MLFRFFRPKALLSIGAVVTVLSGVWFIRKSVDEYVEKRLETVEEKLGRAHDRLTLQEDSLQALVRQREADNAAVEVLQASVESALRRQRVAQYKVTKVVERDPEADTFMRQPVPTGLRVVLQEALHASGNENQDATGAPGLDGGVSDLPERTTTH